jgi:hypothetical protein
MQSRRILQWSNVLLTILVLLLAAIPKPASADGIAIVVEWSPDHDIEMPAQKAILVYDEQSQREDLILSVELRGGSEAAWVVPVPSLPEVETASPEWFQQLGDMTKPTVKYRYVKIDLGGPETVVETVAEDAGVELISREEVGVYDVSILSADEPGALVDWLNENGYAYPEEGEPLLDAYMEEGGWYFVAARVLPGKSDRLDGDVHPLWFSFETERPIYPMRLTTLVKSHLHVLIYVLADHRMEIPRPAFETEFAGKLTLEPINAENAQAMELLTRRPYYVTKLRKERLFPPNWTEDIYFEQSANDEPHRKVVYETEYRFVYEEPATARSLYRSEDGGFVYEEPAGSLDRSEDIGWLVFGLVLLLILALGLIIWRSLSPPNSGREA